MCRLFGMIAVEPELSAPWLLDAEIPILRQANIDPETLQAEGWGLAWFDPERGAPLVEKGAEAVYLPRERERFTAVARSARSRVVVSHLRKASNPMKLPREQLVGIDNSQPFLSDGSIFAHNGWIGYPRETRPRLGARVSKLRGVNDSEVLQQLFLHHLDTSGDPVRAYAGSMTDLHRVWEDQGRPREGPHGGLNLLFSRGPEEMWAFCHYSGDHGTCLSGIPRPYYEMSYVVEPARVVVVSEPTDRRLDRWHPLRSGQYLRLRAREGRIESQQGEVPGLPEMPRGAFAGGMGEPLPAA